MHAMPTGQLLVPALRRRSNLPGRSGRSRPQPQYRPMGEGQRAGAKRQRVAPAAPQRGRERVTQNQGSNIHYVRKDFGRTSRMTAAKFAEKMLYTAVERMQGVRRASNTFVTRDASGIVTSCTLPGYYSLFNSVDATGNQVMPVHAWLLNSRVGSGATALNQGRQLAFNTTGGTVWSNITASQTTDGSSVSNTFSKVEYETAPLANPAGIRYSRCVWYDIRLNLYGAFAEPVTYDIWLCTFTKDGLCPVQGPDDQPVNNFDSQLFWKGIAAPVVYNSILPAGQDARKGMKVLQHKRVVIEASRQDDGDVGPSCQQLKWFYRDGKIYDYLTRGQTANAAALENGGWSVRGATAQTEMFDVPKSRAQIYLVIRATNPVPDDAGGEIVNGMASPSYDLCFRVKKQTET